MISKANFLVRPFNCGVLIAECGMESAPRIPNPAFDSFLFRIQNSSFEYSALRTPHSALRTPQSLPPAHPVPAAFLGLVQRLVRHCHQFLDLGFLRTQRGDAEADRDAYALPLPDIKALSLDCDANALRHLHRRL